MPKKSNRSHGLTALIIVLVVLLIAASAALILLLTRDGQAPGPTTDTGAVTGPPTAPSTEPPTQPPTDPTEPEITTATISVTGDVLMHLPVISSGYSGGVYNFDSMFRYLLPYVQEADYAVANLETTLAGTDNGYSYSGFPKFNCPDEILDALKTSGFDMLLTSNNHCYDTGTIGLTRTLQTAADRELATLGTMASADEPKYRVVDINGIQVGMVCYSYASTYNGRPAMNGNPTAADAEGMINAFDYEQLDTFYGEMEGHIAGMEAEGADAIVLYIHWGNEYLLEANHYQTDMAQKLCDMGVDVIVGGHPHVIQPMELLTSTTDPEQKTVCLYSTGNLISNQRISEMNLKTGHTEDGLLFSFTFAQYPDGEVLLESVAVLPLWVSLEGGKYTILPLDQKVTSWQNAYQLSDSLLSGAVASYARTMDQVGEGLEAVNDYLTTQNEAKLAEFQ